MLMMLIYCSEAYRAKSQYNSPFEGVEYLRYLGTILTNQNSIQGEIKSRLKWANAWYRSVQDLSSFGLLSKNIKIKICRTIILPVL